MEEINLIEEIIKRTELSEKVINEVLNTIIEVVKEKFKNDRDSAKLGELGTFRLHITKQTTGINLRTKKKISIPRKVILKFKPAEDLTSFFKNSIGKRIKKEELEREDWCESFRRIKRSKI